MSDTRIDHRPAETNDTVRTEAVASHTGRLNSGSHQRVVRCEHTVTRDGRCVCCNKLILKTETRQCWQCKHYQKMPGFPNICNKHIMGVTGSMLVTYKFKDVTCWEAPNAELCHADNLTSYKK